MPRRSGFTKTIGSKQWLSTLHGQIGSLDLAEGVVGLGDIGVSTGLSQTILRTRGLVHVELVASTSNERALVAMGIILVPDDAFSVGGVGAMPSPLQQGGDDWIWYGFAAVSGLDGQTADPISADLEIDSKAMRKWREGETLAFVAEIADSVDQTGTMTMMYGARVLVGF